MTYSERVDLEIVNRINFLEGQLSLYKIEFAETGNNNYLEVMHELNRVIKLVRYLRENTLKISKEINKNKQINNAT